MKRIKRKGSVNTDSPQYLVSKTVSILILPSAIGNSAFVSAGLDNFFGPVFYDNQKDNSDIIRNNLKQWDFLNRDKGGKLLKAIEDLGVIYVVGKNSVLKKIV